MRKILSLLFIIFGLTASWCQEQMHTEYLGDNFSLEGALTVFKKATSLEQFERLLNNRNSNVNNLDLNNDGAIDYINVADIKNGDSHVLVLSTFLNETEKQDIAILSLDRTGDAEALLQIEGDIDLYADNSIVEPTEEKETLQESTGGPKTPTIEVQSLLVNVWTWPCVHYIYGTRYVVWVSPYRWNYYPHRWNPWRPFAYNLFSIRCAPHRMMFHTVGIRRNVAAKTTYLSNRHSSTLLLTNSRGNTIFNKKINTRKIKVLPARRIPIRTIPVRKGILSGLGIKRAGRR
jgi:hypothetical protein